MRLIYTFFFFQSCRLWHQLFAFVSKGKNDGTRGKSAGLNLANIKLKGTIRVCSCQFGAGIGLLGGFFEKWLSKKIKKEKKPAKNK